MTVNTWPGWENVRKLGSGSYGSVYEIRREEFGVEYRAALKVISIPRDESEVLSAYGEGMDEKSVTAYFQDLVKDITREFALMSQLKGQTNIVTYEDHMVIQQEGGIGWDILIRMELLTPLLDYCSRQTLSEAEVIRLGCDLCRALEICGKRGVIHRDIKPENIFVSEYGDFELGDFGVARTLEKTTGASTKIGTNNYMAPEVFHGRHYDSRADIYSLGIVLYRYLNDGRTPFLPPAPEPIRYEDRSRALVRRLGGEEIPAPAHGSPELRDVVLRAVAYEPEERFASAEELRKALEQCARLAREAWEEAGAEAAPEAERPNAPEGAPGLDATLPLAALMGAGRGEQTVALSPPAAPPETAPAPETAPVPETAPAPEPSPAPETAPAPRMEALVRPVRPKEKTQEKPQEKPRKTGKKRIIWLVAALAVCVALAVGIGAAVWTARNVTVEAAKNDMRESLEAAVGLMAEGKSDEALQLLQRSGEGLSEKEEYARALAFMTPPEMDLSSCITTTPDGNLKHYFYSEEKDLIKTELYTNFWDGGPWLYEEAFYYPNYYDWVLFYNIDYNFEQNKSVIHTETVTLRNSNREQVEKYVYKCDDSGSVTGITHYGGTDDVVLHRW